MQPLTTEEKARITHPVLKCLFNKGRKEHYTQWHHICYRMHRTKKRGKGKMRIDSSLS